MSMTMDEREKWMARSHFDAIEEIARLGSRLAEAQEVLECCARTGYSHGDFICCVCGQPWMRHSEGCHVALALASEKKEK